jgi:phosphatidylglycerol:prolipoprotein diacylglycerol transferase
MDTPEIWFPNLGIKIQHLDRVALSVFGIEIYWYAIIIVSGMILAFMLAQHEAKRTGQDPDMYWDFGIIAIFISVICARIYYVVFAWDMYKDNLIKVFAVREGGLAIYGGVIGGIITGMVFCKIKKIKLGVLADVGGPSLILGQAIGRWGNFINREAFGGYTDSLFALRYKIDQVSNISQSVFDKKILYNGVEYIQVQPTFLYESLWNLAVFAFLMWYKKSKKFDGEVFLLYLLGYSLGRVWIEGLRTDQLIIGTTGIAVSQLLSELLIIVSIVLLVVNRRKAKIVE